MLSSGTGCTATTMPSVQGNPAVDTLLLSGLISSWPCQTGQEAAVKPSYSFVSAWLELWLIWTMIADEFVCGRRISERASAAKASEMDYLSGGCPAPIKPLPPSVQASPSLI